MSDIYDQQTEELLPCLRALKKYPKLNCGSCDRCIKRRAVATALREQASLISALEDEVARFTEHNDILHQQLIANDLEMSINREQIKALEEERNTYKCIAERNHKANMMPCPKCGHKQTEIQARAVLEKK